MGVDPRAAAEAEAEAYAPPLNDAPVPAPPSRRDAFSSPRSGVWPDDSARRFIASRCMTSDRDVLAARADAAGVRIGVGRGRSE